MFKALILDIDGTLQNKENDTSKETINLLLSLQKQSISVAFATARTKYMINRIVNNFDLYSKHIIEDGGSIYDFQNNTYLLKHTLPQDIVNTVKNHLLGLEKIKYGFSSNGEFYVNSNYYDDLTQFLDKDGLFAIDHESFSPHDISSIWIRSIEEPNMNELKKVVGNNTKFKIFKQDNNQYSCFILPINSSKESCFIKWCEIEKINEEDVLFIGDTISDIGISKLVGKSATISNGEDELKQAVDFISKYSYDSGVRDIIHKFF